MVPSPLLLELLSCPLCARSLETLELELGEPEGGRGEVDGLHDFHQVRNGVASYVPKAMNYYSNFFPAPELYVSPPRQTLMDPQVGDLRGGRGRGRRRGAGDYGNGVVRAFVGFREKLKRIVESKYFNRGIMIAILVNTLSMGIEYHEQVSSWGGSWREDGGSHVTPLTPLPLPGLSFCHAHAINYTQMILVLFSFGFLLKLTLRCAFCPTASGNKATKISPEVSSDLFFLLQVEEQIIKTLINDVALSVARRTIIVSPLSGTFFSAVLLDYFKVKPSNVLLNIDCKWARTIILLENMKSLRL